MKYTFSILLLLSCLRLGFTQNDYTFKNDGTSIMIQQIMLDYYITLDTFYADDCAILGEDVFILSKKNLVPSAPFYIYITHYSYRAGFPQKVNEYTLKPSRETIQVNFELEGGYLRLISKRSITSKDVKPSGILKPFTEEQMVGEKKILNIPLLHGELINLENTLREFNAW